VTASLLLNTSHRLSKTTISQAITRSHRGSGAHIGGQITSLTKSDWQPPAAAASSELPHSTSMHNCVSTFTQQAHNNNNSTRAPRCRHLSAGSDIDLSDDSERKRNCPFELAPKRSLNSTPFQRIIACAIAVVGRHRVSVAAAKVKTTRASPIRSIR
jgi:hypothetical protein